ncbi:MAG TPA: glutathione S-transferase family protein [Caulobacteraceae bacterium]|jgi:glutathione S-transferase
MLTFYHCPGTRSGGVHWLLEELGAPFETEIVPVTSDAGAPESYRAVQPNKKVPAIVHDGVRVHERAAICIYLCDAFPAANLAPPVGDPRRGPYLSWLVYNDAVLDPVIAAKFGNWQYETRGVSFGSFDDMVANLNGTLGKTPYLTGDAFTAADLLLCGGLNFAVNFAKAIPPRPAITDFLQRCMSRPAFARVVARDRAAQAASGAA